MIQPLGVVKQWSLNAKSERVEKFRLTQDLSFSLDVEQDCSVNGRVDLLRYPEMVYGWCLPRLLHLISALRDEHPTTAIFICKYDYSDAYRRVAHSPDATAQTIAIMDNIAYVSLRLTFGGIPKPSDLVRHFGDRHRSGKRTDLVFGLGPGHHPKHHDVHNNCPQAPEPLRAVCTRMSHGSAHTHGHTRKSRRICRRRYPRVPGHTWRLGSIPPRGTTCHGSHQPSPFRLRLSLYHGVQYYHPRN